MTLLTHGSFPLGVTLGKDGQRQGGLSSCLLLSGGNDNYSR